MQAIDAATVIARLVELVDAGPGANPEALGEATAILFRLTPGANGYLSEKLAETQRSFETWLSFGQSSGLGGDPQTFRMYLLQDIEKLRKALARGMAGQD